jgi:hypothetical protein
MPVINRLFGWKDLELNSIPKESSVFVSGHSSFWDIFVIMLYIWTPGFRNTYTIVKPGLSAWYYKPLVYMCNLIFAPPLETRNNNSVEQISKMIETLPEDATNRRFVALSPKGTTNKKEWRTGYYYIAKRLNVRVYPIIFNFTHRRIEFGTPIDPSQITCEEATVNLQKQLGQFRVIHMENAEYDIHDPTGCPYESMFPFDMCCVSLLSFIPYLFITYMKSLYLPFIFTLVTVCYTWIYHLTYEGTIFEPQKAAFIQKTEAYLSRASMLTQMVYTVYYTGILPSMFLVLITISLFFYTNSIPRRFSLCRGKYVIHHSIYHILCGCAAYSLCHAIPY